MLPLIDAIEARLTAIENLLGIATEAKDELRRTDERIAELRHEKEEAIEAQDFTKAAALRDQEVELFRIQARLRKEVRHYQPTDADEESESS
jgi:excinuclease UvrABC nuclease subunit